MHCFNLYLFAAMIPLNRKPTTLAQCLSPEQWRNIADCAYQRNRTYSELQDYDRCSREWQSWETGIAMANLSADPFPIKVGEGIKQFGKSPSWDDLLIDRNYHLESALNGEPMRLPEYLETALCDQGRGWDGLVCEYLRAIDDDNGEFCCRDLNVNGGHDIGGDIELTVFYRETAADHLWTGCYVAVDGRLYDLTDSTIADCGILCDRIGWHVCSLEGEYIQDIESETCRFASGYSENPTRTLENSLLGEPVWHHGLGCLVGRLSCWPHPVRLYPVGPSYGG